MCQLYLNFFCNNISNFFATKDRSVFMREKKTGVDLTINLPRNELNGHKTLDNNLSKLEYGMKPPSVDANPTTSNPRIFAK